MNKNIFQIGSTILLVCIVAIILLYIQSCINKDNFDEVTHLKGEIETLSKCLLEKDNEIENLNDKLEEATDRNTWWVVSQDYYKMFYGEWEIIEVLGAVDKYKDEKHNLEKLVGHKIYFDNTVIRVDNCEIINNPQYSIMILPMKNREWYYIGDVFPKKEDDILHINNEYFVVFDFSISRGLKIVDKIQDIEGFFYSGKYNIKDDNTIILNTGHSGGFIKMERISYKYESEKDEGLRRGIKIEGEP